MSFGYVVRPAANRDIDEIADQLAEAAGLETAQRFLAEIYDTFGLLGIQPRMGWPCKSRHPQLLAARTFPVSARFDKHLIFYQPSSGRIEVLRVVHGSQDLERLFAKEGHSDPSR